MVRKSYNKIRVYDIIFNTINITGLLLLTIISLYPFWNQLVLSFSSGYAVYEGGFMLLPKQFSIETYEIAFRYPLLWSGFFNSIMRALVGLIVGLALTTTVAYPLSKSALPGNKFFTGMLLFTMLFSGGMIPNYLLIKNIGLLDNFWALILPGAVTAWNVLIMRNFFMSIPRSLEESVEIDGGGWYTIFFRIILPLSKPVLATVGLWIIIGHWNAWFDVLLYIRTPTKFGLQIVLRNIVVSETMLSDINTLIREMGNKSEFRGPTIKATVIVTTLIPVLMAYPFIQRYFTKGIMLGAVKG